MHCFGDQDGKKYSAKLQHPLGVAWNNADKMVYIADTYNHKIKKTDSEGNCVTVCGSGKPSKNNSVSFFGMKSLLTALQNSNETSVKDLLFQFDEPSGLAVSQDGNTLYIADTNNHCIKALDLSDIEKIHVVSHIMMSSPYIKNFEQENLFKKLFKILDPC